MLQFRHVKLIWFSHYFSWLVTIIPISVRLLKFPQISHSWEFSAYEIFTMKNLTLMGSYIFLGKNHS